MMSSRYIEESNAAGKGGQKNADKGGGGKVQISAEEIAQVLTNTYSDGSAAKEEKHDEDSRNLRRQQRLKEMKRKKRQQELIRRFMLPCVVIFIVCVILAGFGIRKLVRKYQKSQNTKQTESINDSTLNQASTLLDDDNMENSTIKDSDIRDDDIKDNDIKDSDFVQTDRGQSSSVQGVSDQEHATQADLTQDNSGVVDSDKKDSDISYDSSLNVAGIYLDSTIADRINDEIVQINTVFVQTLGGNSKEPPLHATADGTTTLPDSEVVSTYSVFIDVEAGKILEQMDATARINPASMTKILTLLVAAEHITDADDTFEITQAITDYCYVHDCSNAGFEVGERVTIRDLFYGTALPSGAEAAMGLAEYVSGSQEAFVALMNEKIDALGLSATSHFTNCIGLYDKNHYSTVYDIAVMLKAACDNSFCREVLNARTYTTSATQQHQEGIILSNWFLRRIEDKDTHGEVLCAKTGYVVQSGSCAASLGADKNGREYICVTANANSSWRCIYDHVALYQQLLPD